jgi:hypothetical protein
MLKEPTVQCQFYLLKELTDSVALVHERTIPTKRRHLLAKLEPTFADRGVSHSQ